jgi:hypothetical protein
VSQSVFDFPPKRRKKPFNLHRLLLNSKIIIVEVLSAIVFFLWIIRVSFSGIGDQRNGKPG